MTKSKFQNPKRVLFGVFLVIGIWSLVIISAPKVLAQNTSSSVSLVWESDTYTPPFYKGRALATADGTVQIFALLSSTFGNPAQATYTWKLNGTVLGSLSGVGRSSLTLVGSPFTADRLVVVEVASADGTREGTGVVRIPIAKPRVLLYADSPLAGVLFEHSLTGMVVAPTGTDVTLAAYPYFFSGDTRTQGFSYAWTILGESAGTGPSVTARSEIAGTSTVTASVSSLTHILQRATESISIVLE